MNLHLYRWLWRAQGAAAKLSLPIIYFLLLSSSSNAKKPSCSEFFASISDYERTFYEISQDPGQTLQKVVKESPSSVVKLNVINGTQWLHLGGKLNNFGLVLGTPPASSSDMTLDQAIQLLNETWSPKGVILDFHPRSLIELMEYQNLESQNIWITEESDSLSSKSPSDLPRVIEIPKKFALDPIFDRVTTESILLPGDFLKLKRMVEEAYKDNVDSNELRALKQKELRMRNSGDIKRFQGSFTELFMQALIQLLEQKTLPKMPRRFGRPKIMHHDVSMNKLLPDLQIHDASYAHSDLLGNAVLQAYINSSISSDECTLLSLRAGPLLNGESVSLIDDIMIKYPNVGITVYTEIYDQISHDDMMAVSSRLTYPDRAILAVSDMKSKSSDIDITGSTNRISTPDLNSGGDLIKAEKLFISTTVAIIIISVVFL